jgi:hypothetical protein
VIHEFERPRARAAFRAIDNDEVGVDARLQHRLANAKELHWMADAELKSNWLSAREPAQPLAASKIPNASPVKCNSCPPAPRVRQRSPARL